MTQASKRRGRTGRVENGDELNTSGMADKAVEALMMALDLGWDATVMRNGVIRLTIDHDGRAVGINLPTNQRSVKESVANSWMRKVIRYGDEFKREVILAGVDDWSSTDPATKARGRAVLDGLRSSEVIKDHHALDKYLRLESGVTLAESVNGDGEELVATAKAMGIEDDEPEPSPDEPQVVKIKPWIARHQMRQSGGEVYESRAVLERKWSDGSSDYICAFPDCGWTNVEARNVASHYGGKHGQDRPASQPPASEMWRDPEIRWVPTQRQAGRIARLAQEMLDAQAALGAEMSAHQCAEWIVKKRDEEREHLLDESTPLTDAQVIERVRRLVDGGAYADLMARVEQVEVECAAKVEQAREQLSSKERGMTNAIRTMEQRLAEAQTAAADTAKVAEASIAAAEAKAREATERWQTLRELVNEG